MFAFPLITRELRVQSRKRGTYDTRLGWGLLAVGALLLISWSFPSQAASGRFLFGALHVFLTLMLFLVAPIIAADSISREKREGTLGLLLLANISPVQVVFGKIGGHLIRLLYLALTFVPFLILPLLIGGVEPQDFFFSVSILLSVALAGLSAGLAVSAGVLNFGVAIAASLVLGAILTLVLSSSIVNIPFLFLPNNFMGSLPVWAHTFLLGPAALVLPLQTRDFANTYFTSKWVTFATESGFAFVSLLFLFCAVIFSFLKVRRFRESLAETKRQIMFRRKFLTPVVWRDAYRRSLSRKLDRNPFTWLEYRTAWSRAARLFMLMIALCFETALLQQPFASEDFLTFHFLVLLPLLLFLTLKSTSSFHNERESGAFELLMVTPLTERRIVNGRLKAVAGYFAPTILVLACFALLGFYGNQTFRREPNQLVAAVHLTTLSASFFSVPICGLFFALRSRTFFPALLWTTGIGILAPICLWHAFNGLVWMFARQQGSTLNLLALQLELALQRVWWPVLLSVLAYHILLALSAHKSVVRLLARRQFGTAAV